MSVDSPISMETFEDAVHTWCSGATGLQTIWADQSAPRPPYPYALLDIISGPIADNPQWELRHTFDATRVGEEIEFSACSLCTFTVDAQFFVPLTDSRNPNFASRQYAAKAQGALALPSYLAALRASGVSVLNRGSVSNLNEVIADATVSRSNVNITFGASLNITEYETYIQHVELKSTSLGIDVLVSI